MPRPSYNVENEFNNAVVRQSEAGDPDPGLSPSPMHCNTCAQRRRAGLAHAGRPQHLLATTGRMWWLTLQAGGIPLAPPHELGSSAWGFKAKQTNGVVNQGAHCQASPTRVWHGILGKDQLPGTLCSCGRLHLITCETYHLGWTA